MPLFQFIGAAIGAGLMLSVTSLIWPRVTSDPRPPALTRVRDAVLTTGAGRNAAAVLGVSDESNVQPVSLAGLVTEGANAVVSGVTKSAQNAVTGKILESLAKQFESLPEGEKETFRAQICQPASPSAITAEPASP